MQEDNSGKTELEFIGKFFVESVGLYIKNKSNEHHGYANHEEIINDTKEHLGLLLDGLAEDSKGSLTDKQINSLRKIIKDNLDDYVEKLDQNLTKVTNKALAKDGVTSPNTLQKDQYLIQSGKDSDFAKIGALMTSNKTAQDTTIWEKAAQIAKKIGLNKLANFCEKEHKHAQKHAQMKFIVESAIPKEMKDDITAKGMKANILPKNKNTSKGIRR